MFFLFYFSDAVSRRKKQEINSIRLDQPNEPLRDENRKEMEKIAKPQTHDVRKRRGEDSLEGVLRGYIIVLQSQIQTIGKRARRRGREEEKWLGCWSRANNGLGLPALGARPMQDSAASHQSLALSLGQWQIRSCISRVLHGDQQKEICALEKTTRSTWQHNWRSRLCCQSIWRITGYEYAVHYGERWISGPYFWILLTSVKQERWTWSFLMVVVPRYF